MYSRSILVVAMTMVALGGLAEEQEERDTFRKWRVAVGGSFNGAVSSRLGVRNVPAPAVYNIPSTLRKDYVREKVAAHEYGENSYVRRDSNDNGFSTEYWSLPDDPANGYQGDGKTFILRNAYEEAVDLEAVTMTSYDTSSDECQWGVSAEVSRELWVHDEDEDHRWGVDVVAAFSYFFGRDIYESHGSAVRGNLVREGVLETLIEDRAAMWGYVEDGVPQTYTGYYGDRNYDASNPGEHPALKWSAIKGTVDKVGLVAAHPTISPYYATGDYRELELLFMLRPWYEITDWWRVYGNLGVGVSWGRFESDFSSGNVRNSEDFDQWDVYGVGGIGTMFRYGPFDLSFDVIGRFLRDDMDIHGRNVDGYISRSDWGLRLLIGYEF